MRDGSLYLNFLSDFWTVVWNDRRFMEKAIGAQVEVLHRLYLQAVRAAAPDFIDQLNIFREDFWNLVVFSDGDKVSETKYKLAYHYKSLPFLYNKMFNPTLKLREGSDYTIEQDGGESFIVFNANPFGDPAYPISESGTEKSILFFAPKALMDENDLYELYGHIVGIVQPSSEQYRQLIKGACSLYAKGPVLFFMNAGLNLAAGYPVSRDFDRVIGITNNDTHYVIRTERNLRYEVPLVATLSVQVNSTIKPYSTFIRDIRLMDYLSEPEWWKGGPGNENPEFRIVNYIPEDLSPDLDTYLRDDPEVIDYLFDTYFKFHIFGMQVNTLVVQNFDAIEDFFKLVFDVKPTGEAPYINSFFKAELIFDTPTEDLEIIADIALELPDDSTSRDDAEYWQYAPHVFLNSNLELNSNPYFIEQSAHDRVNIEADMLLELPHRIEGHEYVMGSNLVLGAPLPDGIRERVDIGSTIELEEEVGTPTEVVGLEMYDEDLSSVVWSWPV